MSMKMDTVWQAKVADSAIVDRKRYLDVAGADSIFGMGHGCVLSNWAGSLGFGLQVNGLTAKSKGPS